MSRTEHTSGCTVQCVLEESQWEVGFQTDLTVQQDAKV